MKQKTILFTLMIIAGLLGASYASAMDISIENYYPNPVEAGDYFNIWLKVSNRQSQEIPNAIVKLEPRYPFTLEPGEESEIVINNLPGGGSFVTKKMRVRVDAGAKEGENTLKLVYQEGIGVGWKDINIPIIVAELQTSFDVVLQELNTEGVFIAVANIGKNPANAVTVSIPPQDNFKTGAIASSIVGNLESGDYTLVNFQITSKVEQGARPAANTQQGTIQERPTFSLTDEEEALTVQIEYTDVLGKRRTIEKALMLSPALLARTAGAANGALGNGQFGRNAATTSSLFDTSNKWMWASAALVAFILVLEVYRWIRRKKDE